MQISAYERRGMKSLLELFKLLGDETRFRIIMLLIEEELAVCEIVGVLNLPQPKVSKALSKLRDLDIVTDTRKEKYVYYSLNTKNTEFINIIKEIKNNSISYEILESDKNRLKDKEIYIKICNC